MTVGMDSSEHNDVMWRHFQSFTLTSADMAGVVLFTAAFYIVLLGICRVIFFNRKKLAYCLTAVNAFLMFTLSTIYVLVKYVKLGHNIFDFFGGEHSWWTGRDNVSVVILVMFGTANGMDIALGWVFYREHLYLLTTWIHHLVYIWLVVLVVTGNGYVTTLPSPYTPAFVCAMLEEFPTLLLAIGTIFPRYRQDLAFGISFGLTRILFHIYLLIYMVRFDLPLLLVMCYVNPLLLHLAWFYGWVISYFGDKKKKSKSHEEKSA